MGSGSHNKTTGTSDIPSGNCIWNCLETHLQDNTAAQEQNADMETNVENDTDSFLPSFPAANTTEETAEETDTIQYPSRTRNPPDRYM